MRNILRKGLLIHIAMLMAAVIGINSKTISAQAMERGAYTAPLIVSYANPQTGEIVDGGTNEALGNSMCASVMQSDALIENTGDKTYVTLGFGLASNISNIEVLVQAAENVQEYTAVELTQTGSCERDGDSCIHYRFEVSDTNLLISPRIFVDPMGRDVQFFIQPDTSQLAEESGNYLSEMLVAEEQPAEASINEETASETEEPSDADEADTVDDEKETDTKNSDDESEQETKKSDEDTGSKFTIPLIIIAASAIAATGIGFIIKKRRG